MNKPATAISRRKSGPARSGARDIKPDVVAYKRSRILEEASVLFYERGYEATTLEMLADRLGVTKPFLYTYFKGKSAILAAICELGVMESLAALNRMAEIENNSLQLLKSSLQEVAEIIVQRHDCLVVYQREMMNLESSEAKRILRLRHEFDLRISRLIEDCVQDGFVTVPDAAMMSIWIGGLLSWITSCYRPGSSRSGKEVVSQAVTACLRLIGLT